MKELDSMKKVTTGNVLKWFMCSHYHTPWSYGLIQSSFCSSYCHCPYFRNDGNMAWRDASVYRYSERVSRSGWLKNPDLGPWEGSANKSACYASNLIPWAQVKMEEEVQLLRVVLWPPSTWGTMVHVCPHIQACVYMPPIPIVTMMINLKCCKSHRFTFFPHYWRL